MANIKSAKKRVICSEIRRKHNNALRSNYRTIIKKALATVVSKDKGESQKAVALAIKTLDKAASKKLIHANTAARYKSRLNNKVKMLP